MLSLAAKMCTSVINPPPQIWLAQSPVFTDLWSLVKQYQWGVAHLVYWGRGAVHTIFQAPASEQYHYLMVHMKPTFPPLFPHLYRKTQDHVSQYTIVPPYHLIDDFTSNLKLHTKSSKTYRYQNDARHSQSKWTHNVRQRSSRRVDHPPARTPVQLSQESRDWWHGRQKDIRPSTRGRNRRLEEKSIR